MIHVQYIEHTTKNVSSRLAQVEKSKRKRKAVFVVFAILTRLSNLAAEKREYRLFHTVSRTHQKTEDTTKARLTFNHLNLKMTVQTKCTSPMKQLKANIMKKKSETNAQQM